jgi:Tfp pilus assembly protein PilW
MRPCAGLGLVDALVATLLTSLIMGSLLTLLVQSEGTFDVQQDQMEMRQEARVALDNVLGELRLAGFDLGSLDGPAVRAAAANFLSVVADLDNGSPDPPCSAASEDATGGGAERVTYALTSGRLLRTVACWNGVAWAVESDGDVVAVNLVGEQTVFRYFDASGAEIAPGGGWLTSEERESVRSVEVALDMEDTGDRQAVGDIHTEFRLVGRAELRNAR